MVSSDELKKHTDSTGNCDKIERVNAFLNTLPIGLSEDGESVAKRCNNVNLSVSDDDDDEILPVDSVTFISRFIADKKPKRTQEINKSEIMKKAKSKSNSIKPYKRPPLYEQQQQAGMFAKLKRSKIAKIKVKRESKDSSNTPNAIKKQPTVPVEKSTRVVKVFLKDQQVQTESPPMKTVWDLIQSDEENDYVPMKPRVSKYSSYKKMLQASNLQFPDLPSSSDTILDDLRKDIDHFVTTILHREEPIKDYIDNHEFSDDFHTALEHVSETEKEEELYLYPEGITENRIKISDKRDLWKPRPL